MKLSQLRNLIVVADAGTVRQAARTLNLSQSSVTKSIQQLEEGLGVELLHRGAQGVVPTEAGRALIARARLIEAELRHARNDIDNVLGAGIGEIRISASPTVATGLVPRTVLAFKRARPRVSFLIQEGVYPDVLSAVRLGDIDFAICLVPERPRDDTLHFEDLLSDRLTPAVRVNHPLISARKLTLADLVGYDWVIYRRSRTGWDVFEQTFVTNGHDPPRATIECTSFACTLALVESSDAITLVPSHLFAESWRPRSIVPVLLDSGMPPWQVMAISRAPHELSPVCLAFLDELRRMAGQLSLAPGGSGKRRPQGRRRRRGA
jgi:LysR family transcriptional regulator of abg operon